MNFRLPTLNVAIGIIAICLLSASDVYAKCSPSEYPSMFTQKLDIGGVDILAVQETQESHLNHIKYIYDQVLSKDDARGGKIRHSMSKENFIILVLKEGDHIDEIEDNLDNLEYLKGCHAHMLLVDEIHPVGSEGEELGLKDGTLSELSESIIYFGVGKAYPQWAKRLKEAMKDAIASEVFFPKKVEADLDKSLWYLQYGKIGLEVYLNLWDKSETVLDGAYPYTTNEQLLDRDPYLYELIDEVFPDKLYE